MERFRSCLPERTARDRPSIFRNQNLSNVVPTHVARSIGELTEIKSRQRIALQLYSFGNGAGQWLIGPANFEFKERWFRRPSHLSQRKRQLAANRNTIGAITAKLRCGPRSRFICPICRGYTQ